MTMLDGCDTDVIVLCCIFCRGVQGVCTSPVRSQDSIHSSSSGARFTQLPMATGTSTKLLHTGGEGCHGCYPYLQTLWNQVCLDVCVLLTKTMRLIFTSLLTCICNSHYKNNFEDRVCGEYVTTHIF